MRALQAARIGFPGRSIGALRLRMRFVLQAFRHRDLVAPFFEPTDGTALADVMHHYPETVRVLLWPYQPVGWDAEERLKRIVAYYRVVDMLGSPWRFSAD